MNVLLCLAMLVAAAHARYVFRAGGEEALHIDEKRGGGPCSGNSGGSKLSPGEAKRYLAKHNQLRQGENAGLADLVWDEGLAAQAQKLADKQSNCDMNHDLLSCGGTRLGQNLAWDWSSRKQNGIIGEKCVQDWFDEKSFYDLGSNTCQSGKQCGHYTQVVWKDTTKVGCAERNCGNSRLAICDYYPPGNFNGRKPY